MGRIQIRTALRLAQLTLSASLAVGCAYLPKAGPETAAILDEARASKQFTLLNVDLSVVNAINSRILPTFSSFFGTDAPSAEPKIAVGDVISISIWEAGGGSLFGDPTGLPTTTARPATIPEQAVLPDGMVSVPFVGEINAKDRTTHQLEEEIRAALGPKATDPQVLVTVIRSAFYNVTVTGEGVSGARVPLSHKGDRVLDVIAAAGALKAATYDADVRLTRGSRTSVVPLSTLLKSPVENIFVWPGDTISVVSHVKHFNVFGAAGRNAQIPFEADAVSLSDALAKSNGLVDDRADPSGVFLIRLESPERLQGITPLPSVSSGELLPVIYRFDFSNVQTYLAANRFSVQDSDVLYVASAKSANLHKLFQLFGTLTSPIITGAAVSSAVQ